MHATQPQGASCPEPTRRWDGQPETDADRRFFDLRESGNTGWIDQDGYSVDGPQFVRSGLSDVTGADRVGGIDQPGGPDDAIGTCDICGTSNTRVQLVTDPDPRVPHVVCADAAACAGRGGNPIRRWSDDR
jgi:hypothetical protein